MTSKALISAVTVLFAFTPVMIGQQKERKAQSSAETKPQMTDRCKMMMGRMQNMQQKMTAMDDDLRQKLAAMKAANGQAKIDAMAATITEMAEQRFEMHNMMTSVHSNMTSHAADHQKSGMAMEGCPMMRGMKQAGR